ncbi:MAG: methionyl-tRNA formyltransferase [Thermomicrobiales bacterium]
MNVPAPGLPLRIVFFGSPEFAVPALHALSTSSEFSVALVVTQGPKAPSPVEQAARSLNLPVYKPETLRDDAARQPLVDVDADLFVVAAFGLIFRKKTLAIPRYGAINIHPSLLPRYRGASPIAAAILSGDVDSGVSLMVMDEGIDTGAVVSVEPAPVAADDSTESLGSRLAETGARQMVRDVPPWLRGELRPEPQGQTGASLTRMLTKADGWIDWSRPAIDLGRQIRAMWPWPRAWTTVDQGLIQVHAARMAADIASTSAPGSVIPTRGRLIVATGTEPIELLTVEPAGKRAMPAKAYLNGRRAPITAFGEFGNPGPQPPLVTPINGNLVG